MCLAMVCQRGTRDRGGSAAKTKKGAKATPPQQPASSKKSSRAPPKKRPVQQIKKQTTKPAAKVLPSLTKDSLAAMETAAPSHMNTPSAGASQHQLSQILQLGIGLHQHQQRHQQVCTPTHAGGGGAGAGANMTAVNYAAAAVSVSDDSCGGSEADTHSSFVSDNVAGLASKFPAASAISTDSHFVRTSLQQRDEMERLRVAKTLLYQAFVEALQSGNQQPTAGRI